MNVEQIKKTFNVYAVKFNQKQRSIEAKLGCPHMQRAPGWNDFVGISPKNRHIELACSTCPVVLSAELGKENGRSLLNLGSNKAKCNPKSDFYGADLDDDVKKGTLRVKKSGMTDDRTGHGVHFGGDTHRSKQVSRNPWIRRRNRQ